MKRYKTLLSFVAVAATAATMASADCAAEIAQLTGAGGGVAKDGSRAPLQTDTTAPAARPTADASAETTPEAAPDATTGIAKDGSHVPLEDTTAQDGADVAMSAQDAQAQSQGDETAAAAAAGSGDSPDASGQASAIERAEAALAEGDEAGCLAALEQARGL